MNAHLWLKPLLKEDAKREAMLFASETVIHIDTAGPNLGDVIEGAFLKWLEEKEYDVPAKGDNGDLSAIGVDIKSLQLHGRRGGSPKIHGYARNGPPKYSLLIFGYNYEQSRITFDGVYFVPSDKITWVRAQHYLFSCADIDQWGIQ